MHHDHLYTSEAEPLPGAGRLEDELDYLACIEVTADELVVGWEFLEGHDGDVVCFHDGIADCGDPLEEVAGEVFIFAWEGADELGRSVLDRWWG